MKNWKNQLKFSEIWKKIVGWIKPWSLLGKASKQNKYSEAPKTERSVWRNTFVFGYRTLGFQTFGSLTVNVRKPNILFSDVLASLDRFIYKNVQKNNFSYIKWSSLACPKSKLKRPGPNDRNPNYDLFERSIVWILALFGYRTLGFRHSTALMISIIFFCALIFFHIFVV